MRDRIETVLATVFGSIFLGLAVVVTIETLARKLFNVSLQGADELGGYALAVGSTLSFSLALMGRAHIRVDVFHDRFPARAQAVLNWISIVSMAAFGVFIAWVAFKVIGDTLQYGSTAQTPWATPLIWPAGRVVRRAGDLCAGGGRLRTALQCPAVLRPRGRGQPRLPPQERQGRTEGRTRGPGRATGRRRRTQVNVVVISLAFFAMLAMMLVGMPIAVSMAVVGIVGGIAAYGIPFMDSIAPVVWGVQNENLLTCIPLFVLLGELLLRSGIADRMYIALSAWLGRLPGGLLHTNIGSCALFAATSGSSVATAATVGHGGAAIAAEARLLDARLARLAGGRRHAGHPDPAVGQPDRVRLADQQLDRQAVHRRHRPGPAADRLLHAVDRAVQRA